MLRIDLTPFEPGVHRLALTPEAATLDLDPERFADIRVDVLIDYDLDQAFVSLDASAAATLECDRTLVRFEQSIEGSYRLLFASPALGGDRREAGDKDDFEEVRVLDPAARQLDLTDVVRDTLLLAVPARKVAPGAEDEAIPTVFGAPDDEEPSIDPRWEALRALRSGESHP